MSGRTAPTYGEVVAGFMFLADDLRRVSEDAAADLHHRASELRVRAARCGMRGVA